MKQETIDAITYAKDVVTTMLITNHSCGWLDGGCYTLAKAITEGFPDTLLYHVSRDVEYRDHAVVYIPSLDMYYDADGVQTETELMNKMRDVEMTNVTVCVPFLDIEAFVKSEGVYIFEDVKRQLVLEMHGHNL
ncbi:hypothetical protein [Moritella sp. F3]|uniref:hypothetical protein n=1 Tax=Moritella sp. F3 TaxID=2718882 RepID=UPI0018E13A75|nr:hypothetical protein [Moritella sp. F3]GIC77080.1 hypothetical protein FMO001_18070 [Moritella sp. F1]GIC82199.1 hypothetical protein FMO003_24800 [Moritella sp. F3]